MKVEKDGLKLLDDLEKLDGLPLEKKGTEIKKSLNIDENLLQKIERISSPYILIEGDRDKAINLAAYIYLEKSTVYSSVYLLRRHEIGGMPIENPFEGVKKSLKVYTRLFHYKSKKEVRLSPGIRTNKPPMVTYKYLNQNGFMESLGTQADGNRLHGGFFIDYYKGIENKPFCDKGKLIREIIYENNFGYADWITHPGTLNTLEIMDKGLTTAMTCFDMLKFKNTVFLLDFMKGVKDKDCAELLEFSQKLHTLETNSKRTYPGNLRFPSLEKPGFLIVHTDSLKEWPAHFRELFYVIPLVKTKGFKIPKEKDSLADVKLKMIVDWKANYGNSHYQVSVTCNNPLNDEFKLPFRFMPVLYLLVKGVKKGTLYVPNKELKKAREDLDDAKKEIIQAFAKVIGQRAKKIIKIETGIGKKLMIPNKNIILQTNEPTFKDKI